MSNRPPSLWAALNAPAANHNQCSRCTLHQTYRVPLLDAPRYLTSWLLLVHRRVPALAPLLTQPPELHAYSTHLLLRWLGALLSTLHRWSPSSCPTPPLLGAEGAIFFWMNALEPPIQLFPAGCPLYYHASPAGLHLSTRRPALTLFVALGSQCPQCLHYDQGPAARRMPRRVSSSRPLSLHYKYSHHWYLFSFSHECRNFHG